MPEPRYVSHDDINPKTRLGIVKPSLSAVPATALFHLARAMMDGVEKYGIYNWREKDVPARIYIDAAMRHILSWADGEEVAEDSKVHHLAHAMACCAIVLDAYEHGALVDDRGLPGKSPEVLRRMSEELKKAAEHREEMLAKEKSELRAAVSAERNRVIQETAERMAREEK